MIKAFLLLGSIALSMHTYAQGDCAEFKRAAFAKALSQKQGFKDQMYADIPTLSGFDSTNSIEDIKYSFSQAKSHVTRIKLFCEDGNNLFFSAFIGDQEVDFMKSVILFESGRYFSGPHPLEHKVGDVVIIQSDMEAKSVLSSEEQ